MFDFDPRDERPWHHAQAGDASMWTVGHWPGAATWLGEASRNRDPKSDHSNIAEGCGLGALVVETPDLVLAAVDHCRSVPLFYAQRDGAELLVSDDARKIASRMDGGDRQFDGDLAVEAAMSGYVTGADTLHSQVNQLRAGELLVWHKASRTLRLQRHYVYLPAVKDRPQDRLAGDLLEVLDAIFRRLVASAAGRPIWVPLSGGLDSRLVLAKLAELQYPALQAFSYGPTSNPDARVARRVAEQLNVPWTYVPTSGRKERDFFASDMRRDYWAFADGLCSVPNNQDLLPLLTLRESGRLPGEAVVVNGQTGDFISGGHIPQSLMSPKSTHDDLCAAILEKHYGLWGDLNTEANRTVARERIAAVLDLPADQGAPLDRDHAVGAVERWEYEERQAKYVVNGQRIYEFLGLSWELPFWDKEFTSFWQSVPVPLKFGQKLYRTALDSWNFEGVFEGKRHSVSAWSPLTSAWLLPLSIATRLVVGRSRRDRLMNYAKYLDRFGNHYAAFGFREFARHVHEIRNPASLYTKAWLSELGLWGGLRS